jgi:hypothetical protein
MTPYGCVQRRHHRVPSIRRPGGGTIEPLHGESSKAVTWDPPLGAWVAAPNIDTLWVRSAMRHWVPSIRVPGGGVIERPHGGV